MILILFPLILENYFKGRYITKYRLDLNLYERREKEIENCILEDSTYAEFKIYNTLDFVFKIGSAEDLNLLIGNTVANALIGNEANPGFAYSLKQYGANDFSFATLAATNFFIVRK